MSDTENLLEGDDNLTEMIITEQKNETINHLMVVDDVEKLDLEALAYENDPQDSEFSSERLSEYSQEEDRRAKQITINLENESGKKTVQFEET